MDQSDAGSAGTFSRWTNLASPQDQVIIGGEDPTKQAIVLSTRPHVIVATPGRLMVTPLPPDRVLTP
eukprot:1881250-Pyramimonas_sp.AAC.1